MKLNEYDISQIQKKLLSKCPEMAFEINALAAQARGDHKSVLYVEVTHGDGTKQVMPSSAYQRLTATALAHSSIRVLSELETKREQG